MTIMDNGGDRRDEAEIYRLKGELTLQQENQKLKSKRRKVPDPTSQSPEFHSEAEVCFLKAIEVARKQQAKSLELRAVMSLVRLRQHQAQNHVPHSAHHKTRQALDEAHKMLSEIYNWFTEGFDTRDLQEARALLGSLESGV